MRHDFPSMAETLRRVGVEALLLKKKQVGEVKMTDYQLDTDKDFHYHTTIDFNESNDCASYGCGDDGYCRCGRLVNPKVTSFGGISAKDLIKGDIEDELDRYALERVMRHTLSPDMFEVNVCSGYYGEEVASVKLVNVDALARKLEGFNRLEVGAQRLQMALTLEYGYLLPEVESVSQWSVLNLNVKDVHVDGPTLKRVNEDVVSRYCRHEPEIVGVVVDGKGEKPYRLVDGFHRWTAWMNGKKRRKVKVIGPVQS